MSAGCAALDKTDKITIAAAEIKCNYLAHGKCTNHLKKHKVYDENNTVKVGDTACTTEICLSLVIKCPCSAEAAEEVATTQPSSKGEKSKRPN